MEYKTWQEELTNIVDRYMTFDKLNLERLYIELEHKSQEFIKKGLMKEGEPFPICMEAGVTLELKCYKNYSTLDQIDSKGNITVMISKENSVNHEYQTLWAVESALSSAGLGIGFKYPPELPEYLQNLNVGDIFVSNSKHQYVCTAKDSIGTIIFQERCPKYFTPSISDFKNVEQIFVMTNSPISVQEFYRKTREHVPESITYRYTSLTESQEFINKMFAGLNDDIRQIDIGPNRFYVSRIGKTLAWLDSEGNNIDESTIKTYIAWLNAAPVITDYRINSDICNFEDRGFAIELESLLFSHDYKKAFNLILDYCKERNDDHIFEMKTYIKDEGSFKAISFSDFPPGLGKLMMSEFWNEDFSKRKNRVEISEEEFEAFCKAKYENNYVHFMNQHLLDILDKYPNCAPQIAKHIAENMAEKSANTEFIKIEEEEKL